MAPANDSRADFIAYRKRLGLSVRETAKQLNVSHVTVLGWEDDKKPTTPGPAYREAIERWSGGKVRAKRWTLSGRESAIAARAARVRLAS